MNAKLLMVHALSPLHAGTGQGAGILDLPIAREKSTNYPYLPGSSLKGTLRDACLQQDGPRTLSLFGPETANASDYAGALVFTDQRLLLFPVRSLQGTFAWVTCPLVLERFRRDSLELEAPTAAGRPALPQVPPLSSSSDAPADATRNALTRAVVTPASVLVHDQHIYLEDMDLSSQRDSNQAALIEQWAAWLGERLFPDVIHTSESANQKGKEHMPTPKSPKGSSTQGAQPGATQNTLARSWRQQLAQRLCLVHDDVFSFLVETATEVCARIRLQPASKTVAPGGLWYEEHLPAESILSGFVAFMPNQKTKEKPQVAWETLHALTKAPLQLGGKATVGRGLCSVRLHDAGGSHADT